MSTVNKPGRGQQQKSHPSSLPSEMAQMGVSAESGGNGVPPANRRDFLRAAGFSLAAAMGGCSPAPVEHALSYIKAPENALPGRPVWYASVCHGCQAGCGLLVKNRDGRPIKLEGNPQHPLTRGGLCAAGQASVLGVYDDWRLRSPMRGEQAITWKEADSAITERLKRIQGEGGAVRFLTSTMISPTKQEIIQTFLRQFSNGKHVVYDALSCSALLDAYQRTHGKRLLPHYRFDQAEIIVGFDADFLGTWLSPVEYAAAYTQKRLPQGEPAQSFFHTQFESWLSLTGSKADQRYCLKPSEMAGVIAQLAKHVARMAGQGIESANLPPGPIDEQRIERLAAQLWQARGKSLVLCGLQDIHAQILCNSINELLQNYGASIDIQNPSYQRSGSDGELELLLTELREGRVAALFLDEVNPVYDLPQGEAIAQALSEVPLVVSFAPRLDETARLAHYLCPEHHYLEGWSDAAPVDGLASLSQPVIQPLWNTRSVIETLSVWMAQPQSAYEAIRAFWKNHYFPRQSSYETFTEFWDRALHDGYARFKGQTAKPPAFNHDAVNLAFATIPPAQEGVELVLYPKVGMLDGAAAYNPWLQELPDPVSKVTWGNYLCLSPDKARQLDVEEGEVIHIEADGGGTSLSLELPACIQPGQHSDVVAAALGYGRDISKRFAGIGPNWIERRSTLGENGLVGQNAAPLLQFQNGVLQPVGRRVRLTKTSQKAPLASTQEHHTVSVPENLAFSEDHPRPIVREFSVKEGEMIAHGEAHHHEHEDLWPPDHQYNGHHWGLAIDMEACIGCSACVIACQVENNIPVVGKDEVRRNREMHWLRIDRYFMQPNGETKTAFQPMMCQQCDHAPCETVCPVLATVHSDEGLNQQVYNRCVGTRYCANNCPYKVRRFNWFKYAQEGRLQNLVLNPDVTVRSRGVMEKCTFCVQRIQEAKIQAKKEGRQLADGEIKTACQQSCPTNAIVFGDMNDPESEIAKRMQSKRHYRVLEEHNFRPSVGYLAVVQRNEEA